MTDEPVAGPAPDEEPQPPADQASPPIDPPADQGAEEGDQAPALPSLPKRLIDVFFSPGKLTEALAANPAWGAALAVVIVLIALQTAFIPADVLMEAQREAILERGGDPSQIPESMGNIMRFVGVGAAAVGVLIFTFLFAGVYTVVFAFVLGDEGGYKQYLSVTAHAWFISVFIGLLILPLKISTGDPQLTINLSGFLFFLEDGTYPLAAVRLIDLSAVWASLVIAQGAHQIDRKRSFGSAATVTVGLQVVIALVMAIWIR